MYNLPGDIKKIIDWLNKMKVNYWKTNGSSLLMRHALMNKYCLITLKWVERLTNKLIFILN